MNNLEEKMFDFMYQLALKDAIQQKAFKGKKKHLIENNDSKNLLKQFVDNLLNGNIKENEFDEKFKELLGGVEKSFEMKQGEKQGKFTFGNTQKLVNMTIKYVYLTTYKTPKTREYFKNCHCPMDRIMKNKVWKELKKKVKTLSNQNQKGEGQALIKKIKNDKKNYDKAWSQVQSIDDQQYKLFQEAVRFLADLEKITPLEYDYAVWGT